MSELISELISLFNKFRPFYRKVADANFLLIFRKYLRQGNPMQKIMFLTCFVLEINKKAQPESR